MSTVSVRKKTRALGMVLNWRTAQRYRPASFSTSEGLFIDDQSVTGSRGASVWRRPAPPRAELGAPLIHGSRPPAEAAPGRRVCARRPPRRHQRALVLVDDERR